MYCVSLFKLHVYEHQIDGFTNYMHIILRLFLKACLWFV